MAKLRKPAKSMMKHGKLSGSAKAKIKARAPKKSTIDAEDLVDGGRDEALENMNSRVGKIRSRRMGGATVSSMDPSVTP